ncbi:MAG: nucleotide sugar dehydrogenase [Candidatus Thermoplasmatota archaeon]
MLSAIAAKEARVAVIGLGTIGLPLATFAAASGFRVRGLDIDPTRVGQINDRTVHFEYSAILRDLDATHMRATTSATDLAGTDAFFFCIPTPVDDHGRIVLAHLQNAAQAVAPHIRAGALVVLESSVEIGTTRWFAKVIEDASGKVAGRDYHLAYCPERYNPGLPSEQHAQVIYGKKVNLGGPLSYHNVPRVVGGIDASSTALATRIYSEILASKIQPVSAPEVAEAAKLMENIFRDVNIALANEFAEVLGALGVDTYEVVNAASSKGFAFLAHQPGLVGGECIPVDTWYLIRQAERVGVACDLMRAARKVNDGVVDHVVGATLDALENEGIALPGAKVTILGTAYKENVYDDRVSPSRQIAQRLRAKGIDAVLCDPVVKAHNHRTQDTLVDLPEAIRDANAVILATAHREFRDISPESLAKSVRTRILVDARNALDHKAFRAAGFRVTAWGRALDG